MHRPESSNVLGTPVSWE